MKVRTADGYQHGKAYRVALTSAYQYADTVYKSTELQPKIKLAWTGKHGTLTQTFGIPIADGEPVLRPNLALSRALQAHGVTWDEIKTGLVIEPIDRKERKAYADWRKLPPFAAHKTDGFEPVAVDIEVGGRSLIGTTVIATVELTNDGIARPESITPDPDADEPWSADDDAPAVADDEGDDD